MLAAERDHGHASAGIDAAADEEEIAIAGAPFWRLEGEVSRPIANHSVNGSAIGCVFLLNVKRRPEVLNNDVLPKIRQAHSLQLVEAQTLERDTVLAGIWMLVIQIGDMRKNLDIVASGRSLRGIGARGRNHLDGEVIGKLLLTKDAIEVRVLVAGVKEVVVRQLRIDAVKSEVDHNSRT